MIISVWIVSDSVNVRERAVCVYVCVCVFL